jgi:hypothetical protein
MSGNEKHSRKVTLIATAAVAVLLALMVYIVQLLVEQQRIERCLASRRPDCFRIETPTRDAPAELKR